MIGSDLVMSELPVDDLRSTFRAFKRAASRLRDGHDSLGPAGAIRFSTHWEEGQGATSTFNESDPLVRFAALLRPFMNPGSSIELRETWAKLLEHGDLVDTTARDAIEKVLTAAENLGIAVVLNQRNLTTRDIFMAYAEGEFFDEKPEAKELLRSLSFGPMAQMLPFLFYSACANYASVAYAILKVILAIERSHPELKPTLSDSQCIYCLTRAGDFGPEEHVIPEAFGLDEMILHGSVCSSCNNILSRLDQHLADFELLAPLRVHFVPLTKKGKFPRADLGDVVIEKTKPRHIRFVSKTGRRVFTETKLPDGRVHLSSNLRSRKPVDMFATARAIFKIALGVVAYDAGVDFACGERFNPARAFIRGEGTMPNHLVMPRTVTPVPEITTSWDPSAPTAVLISIFGVVFIVNLDTHPLGLTADAPQDTFFAFWLGEKTKKGIVPPCGVDCAHMGVGSAPPTCGGSNGRPTSR